MLKVFWACAWLIQLLLCNGFALYWMDKHNKKTVRENGITVLTIIKMMLSGAVCFLIFVTSAISPFFFELPKNFSGKSVATVEGGRLVYHPYGILTPPWKWDDQKVVVVRDLHLPSHEITQLVRNNNGVVGIAILQADIISTDPEMYAIASTLDLPGGRKGQSMVWWIEREFSESILNEAQSLKELVSSNEKGAEAIAVCDKITRRTNMSLEIYGVRLENCRASFLDNPNSWGF